MAKNPDRVYNQGNREQEGAAYDATKPGPAEYAKQRLLALLQMTYVGAPMVYYGDETGMWGSNDPNNRKPMLWEDLLPYEDPQETIDPTTLAHYRAVIGLRRAHPALRTGSFRTALTDDAQDTWVFVRSGGGEEVLVELHPVEVGREVVGVRRGERARRIDRIEAERVITPRAAERLHTRVA